MKPDKPGEWHSRDGQTIVVWRYNGELSYRYKSDDEPYSPRLEFLEGDDWLPAVAPTFPEPPPKPHPRVLANLLGYLPMWWYWTPHPYTGMYAFRNWLTKVSRSPGELQVVPHPDNDPAAEKLIKDAQR